MDPRGLQDTWDALGKDDPLWAVLSYPDKRGGRWDIDEFLATGVREIDEVLAWIEASGLQIPRGRALDFGCGVGRLTQALSKHFEGSTGVDIAPSMIEVAERIDRQGARCEYVLNTRDDLRIFDDDSFGFVYSAITLQHMPPSLMRKYLREFVRILAPGGLLVFQVPAAPPASFRNVVKRLLPPSLLAYWARMRLRAGAGPRMQMFWLKPARAMRLLRRCGAEVVAVQEDHSAGPGWSSRRYLVRSTTAPAGTLV